MDRILIASKALFGEKDLNMDGLERKVFKE